MAVPDPDWTLGRIRGIDGQKAVTEVVFPTNP